MRIVALLVLAAVVPPAASQDGTLDPTMGGNGVVFGAHPLGQVLNAFDVAVQPDGRILVAGGIGTYNSFVARHLPEGGRDVSFSGDGFAGFDLTTVSFPDGLRALALLADGRILAAGYFVTDFMVARLTDGGGLDPAFGEAPFSVFRHYFGEPGASRVEDLVVTSAGYVAVGGARQDLASWTGDFGILRVTTDGVLDPTFNGGSPQVIGFTSAMDHASAVVESDDGRLLVAGTAGVQSNLYRGHAAFVRLHGDGSLDTTFLDGGYGIVPLGIDSVRVDALAEGPGDTFYAAGYGGPDAIMLVIRIHGDGSLDETFGEGGLTPIPMPGETTEGRVRDLVVQADGKVVLAGAYVRQSLFLGNALARVMPDGALDPSFGTSGIALTPIRNPSLEIESGSGEAIALQSDGRIVAVGTATCLLTSCGYAFIARYRNQPVSPSEPGAAESAVVTARVAPNPAAGFAVASINLARSGHVRGAVYDMLGRVVAPVVDRVLPTGPSEVVLEVAGRAPGLYLLRIEAHGAASAARFTVMR